MFTREVITVIIKWLDHNDIDTFIKLSKTIYKECKDELIKYEIKKRVLELNKSGLKNIIIKAVDGNKINILEYMIDRNLKYKKKILKIVIEKQNEEIFRHLLKKYNFYKCLLELCCTKKGENFIKILINDYIEKINIYYILSKACTNGWIDIIKLIIKLGAKDNIFWYNGIENAIKNRHFDIVKLMIINPQTDLSNDYHYIFNMIVDYNQIQLVEMLLDDGLNIRDNESIINACYYGFTEILNLLLLKIDPTFDDNYLIKTAVKNNKIEVVEILLTDCSVDPSKALEIACKKGLTYMFNIIIYDSRINIKNCIDKLLQIAIDKNHTEIIQIINSIK